MDSPAEYVSQLEAELRQTRSALAARERELQDLKAELATTDELRGGLRDAAVSAAEVTEQALRRLQEQQPIIDAAVAFVEAHGKSGPIRGLYDALDALVAAVRTRQAVPS